MKRKIGIIHRLHARKVECVGISRKWYGRKPGSLVLGMVKKMEELTLLQGTALVETSTMLVKRGSGTIKMYKRKVQNCYLKNMTHTKIPYTAKSNLQTTGGQGQKSMGGA